MYVPTDRAMKNFDHDLFDIICKFTSEKIKCPENLDEYYDMSGIIYDAAFRRKHDCNLPISQEWIEHAFNLIKSWEKEN